MMRRATAIRLFVLLFIPVSLLALLALAGNLTLPIQPDMAEAQVDGPDLVVEDMIVCENIGVGVAAFAKIRNIGSLVAGPSEVKFSGYSVDYLPVPALSPGQAAVVSTSNVIPMSMTYTAIADWNNRVAETNEDNNSLSKWLQPDYTGCEFPELTPTSTATPTQTPTPTPTPTVAAAGSGPVGGIAEFSEGSDGPKNDGLQAGRFEMLVGAMGMGLLAVCGWQVRRRFGRQRR